VYTGIVEELGEVVGVQRLADAARITVRGPLVTSDAGNGDSLNINGVCLTVTGTQAEGGTFTADVMLETLNRSSLGDLRPGSPVNLERPMRLDGRLGGHLVQGHVDGTGTIVSRSPGREEGRGGGWGNVVRIELPPSLARYVVEKGSIGVDGVSLTVTATGEDPANPPGRSRLAWFEVSLIPETLQRTTLGLKQPGDTVNLEVDVIAKYVEKLLAGGAQS
jgi:riboflavin synthase